MEYVLILLVVLLTSTGQVLQKLGADRGLASAETPAQMLRALFQWEIILAVTCLGSAVLVWLFVLYRMDVSKAFPFISLGFVMVLLFARVYLKESVPVTRWFGVGLIVAGIFLLSMS